MRDNIPSEAMIAIVNRALNSPNGIELPPFATPGAAIHWRQRYYKVRARLVKNDPAHEWRTMSCVIPSDRPNIVQLRPADTFIDEEGIKEL